ncbi:MAG: hypothetical protein HY335_03600 [Deinococcus sp.]|nr:hypothetical protein [Deinococcus sp.]
MTCLDCHTEPLHGDGTAYDSRWAVAGLPHCTDCHQALPAGSTPAHLIPNHQQVSCQVCHAQPYKNCFTCHSSFDEAGIYHRRPERTEVVIKTGRNTVPGYPYDVVPLRQNPVDRHSFDYFGENLLPYFDNFPSWKTAAPHNIQRSTDQNRSCNSCHGNQALFLSADDLDPGSSQANQQVVLEKIP